MKSYRSISLRRKGVSRQLTLVGDFFWDGGHHIKFDYAAQYETDKIIVTGQVASTGMVGVRYVHKFSDMVSLSSDIICNYLSRDVTASVGYDIYIHRYRCRFGEKLDFNGCSTSYLEHRLNPGLSLVFSSEINNRNNDWRIGFGFTVGE